MAVLKYWDGAAWQALPTGSTDVAVGPVPPVRTTETIWVDSDAPAVLNYWDGGTWKPLPTGSAEIAINTAQPTRTTELLWIDPDEPSAPTTPTLVTSLPAGPADGQEVYFLADTNSGVMWHLRYRANSPSAYKWEYLGGPPVLSAWPDVGVLTSASWTYVPNSAALTIPLTGEYLIGWQNLLVNVNGTPAGSAEIQWTLCQGAVPAGVCNYGRFRSNNTSTFEGVTTSSEMKNVGTLAAGTVLKLAGAVVANAGGVGFQFGYLGGFLTMRPLRVG